MSNLQPAPHANDRWSDEWQEHRASLDDLLCELSYEAEVASERMPFAGDSEMAMRLAKIRAVMALAEVAYLKSVAGLPSGGPAS